MIIIIVEHELASVNAMHCIGGKYIWHKHNEDLEQKISLIFTMTAIIPCLNIDLNSVA